MMMVVKIWMHLLPPWVQTNGPMPPFEQLIRVGWLPPIRLSRHPDCFSTDDSSVRHPLMPSKKLSFHELSASSPMQHFSRFSTSLTIPSHSKALALFITFTYQIMCIRLRRCIATINRWTNYCNNREIIVSDYWLSQKHRKIIGPDGLEK